MRALALLRCAVEMILGIKACSINKHKSWYTFLAVWVVPRQIAKRGDLWAYGTAPVEQRGARLKKFVRNVVSWRPYAVPRRDGRSVGARRSERHSTG